MWEALWNLSAWTRLPVFVEDEGCLFGPNAQTWKLFLGHGTNTWSSHFLYFTPLPSVPRKTENQTRQRATRHAKPICSAYCSSHVARTRLNGMQEKKTQCWGNVWEMRICPFLDPAPLADHRHRTSEKWRWSIDWWAMCSEKANMECICHWGDGCAGKYGCTMYIGRYTQASRHSQKIHTLFYCFPRDSGT